MPRVRRCRPHGAAHLRLRLPPHRSMPSGPLGATQGGGTLHLFPAHLSPPPGPVPNPTPPGATSGRPLSALARTSVSNNNNLQLRIVLIWWNDLSTLKHKLSPAYAYMIFFIIIHHLGHRVCFPYTYHRLWRMFFLDIEVWNIMVNTAAFVSILSLSRIIFRYTSHNDTYEPH